MKRFITICIGAAFSLLLLEFLSLTFFAYEKRQFFYSWDGRPAGDIAPGY